MRRCFWGLTKLLIKPFFIVAAIFVVFYGLPLIGESCYNMLVEEKRAVSDYVRLSPKSYRVWDIDKLKSNRWNPNICYIDGVDPEKMYYLDSWDVDYFGEDKTVTGVYVAPDSGIKEPVLEFDWYRIGFIIAGSGWVNINSRGYFDTIKNALNSSEIEVEDSNIIRGKTIYIFLDETENLYFRGTVRRIRKNNEAERFYTIRAYLDGEYREFLLEDKDGFYDWLDENIFVDAEENNESLEDIAPAA